MKRRICIVCNKKRYMDRLIRVLNSAIKSDIWVCKDCGIDSLFDNVKFYDYSTMNDCKFKKLNVKISKGK